MAWSNLLAVEAPTLELPVKEWFEQLSSHACLSQSPFSFTLFGGRTAPSYSHAFLAGYQAALRTLIPNVPAGIGTFCLTEKTGSNPLEIKAEWKNGKLNGTKNFALLDADWFVVIASDKAHSTDTHAALRALLVEKDSECYQFDNVCPTDLLPELQHRSVTFNNCPATELSGDGWNDFSKVFRTLEDAYVLAATIAWLYRAALEEQWPDTLIISFLGIIASLNEALNFDPKDHMAHFILESAFMQFDDLSFELSAAMVKCKSKYLEQWKRDKAVMSIGKQARYIRLQKALTKLNIH